MESLSAYTPFSALLALRKLALCSYLSFFYIKIRKFAAGAESEHKWNRFGRGVWAGRDTGPVTENQGDHGLVGGLSQGQNGGVVVELSLRDFFNLIFSFLHFLIFTSFSFLSIYDMMSNGLLLPFSGYYFVRCEICNLKLPNLHKL